MNKLILRSTLRNLIHDRSITLINTLGLVTALLAVLFLLNYILYEKSFDTFHPDFENIYRIETKITKNGELNYHGAKSPQGIFHYADKVDEIEAVTSFYYESCQVKYDDLILPEQNVMWSSDGLEQIFNPKMQIGTIDMKRAHTGIISSSKAKAIFGNENPIGKIIKVNEGFPIEITGIYHDLPSNTHLVADYFISMPTWLDYGWVGPNWFYSWNGNSMWNYIKIKPENVKIVKSKLNEQVKRERPNLTEQNTTVEFELTKVSDIHFRTELKGDYGPKTNIRSIHNLILFGIFVLLIAAINFINLKAAQSLKNAKSLGIHKLIGANTRHIVAQVMTESGIYLFASVVFSLLLYKLLLPGFSMLFDMPVKTAYFKPFEFVFIFSVVVGVTFLLTATYSVFTLFRINPFNAKVSIKEGYFRKVLVVLQLSVTMLFFVLTIMVYKQLHFMQNYNLGADIDQVIVLSGPTSFNGEENYTAIDLPKINHFRAFRNILTENPSVISGTAMYDPIGIESRFNNVQYHITGKETSESEAFYRFGADNEFFKTFGIPLLAGSAFPKNTDDYRRLAIINLKAMKQLGIASPDEAIGQQVERGNDIFRIIGVIGDYHHEGLHKETYPMVIEYDHPSEFGYYAFRVSSAEIQKTVQFIKENWTKQYPRDPFNFFFQDEFYNRQYHSEVRLGRFYSLIALVSIFINCLGLYGMILFFITRKVKEVGIRKVNGAGVFSVVTFLNRNIMIWLAVSVFLATPLSIYLTQKWLENFAYRTKMELWVFIVSGLSMMAIALLTVSWQSWKAATRNPVEALRYE